MTAMTKIIFASTPLGFHHAAPYPTGVEITPERYRELLMGHAAGLLITSDDDGNPQLSERPTPTVVELRGQLTADINTWRDSQEGSGILFDYAGRRWDGGLTVRTRLQPVVALAQLPSGFYWTSANNEDVPMDLEALRELNAAHEAALVARGWEIHARQRCMKLEVAELDTAEALQAYVVGWPAETEA